MTRPMTVRDYRELIRRHWRVLLAAPLLAAVLLLGWSLVTPRSYAAAAQVQVTVGYFTTAADVAEASALARNNVPAYATLATQSQVLDGAILALGLPTTSAQLHDRVSATSSKEMSLIEITAVAESAQGAAELADAVATELGEVIRDYGPRYPSAADEPLLRTVVVSPAVAPATAESPKTARNVACGLLAGAVAGFFLALSRERRGRFRALAGHPSATRRRQ